MEEYYGFTPGEKEEEKSNGKSVGFKQFKKKFTKKPEEKAAVRKEIRKKKQEKKKRLIIRNLSFKVNEEELKKEFSKFGDVVDINIPRKPDGKMRGFAFVQYQSFQSAIEAVKNLNFQKLKGRPIAVDYTVSKDKYQHVTSSKHTTNNISRDPKNDSEKLEEEIDSEVEKTISDDGNDDGSDDDSKSDVKEEGEEKSDSDVADDHVKKFLKEFNADQESLQGSEDEAEESCSESDSSSESNDDSSHFERFKGAKEDEAQSDDDSDNYMDDEAETNTLKKRKASAVDDQGPLKKKKNYSNDVNEGKTVFIRNISFDSDEDALKRLMETFGPVKYCLLVIDKFTELPRGTAFVKFENKEDADKVIQRSSETDPEGICLDGRKLYCSVALSREELESKRENGATKKKDKRNLCLLKVGLIKKDSPEAEGVSQSDLAKRTKLEIMKRTKLKNLQFFVSDKRLCIHNIPSYYKDAELRALFKRAAGPGAKITEARIMRDFKKINTQRIAQSKGFGFVAFEKHEDALKALNEINNKPNVFTQQQRPIVEFSIENMNALLMQKRRKERSALKIKKNLENSEANHPEESLSSLKFNQKRNFDKGNKEIRKKKMPAKAISSKKNQQNKAKVNKNKMETKLKREGKQQQISKKHQSNNTPVKETPQKKKNKKQKKKGRGSSESMSKDNFGQMINKYKEKLLSKM